MGHIRHNGETCKGTTDPNTKWSYPQTEQTSPAVTWSTGSESVKTDMDGSTHIPLPELTQEHSAPVRTAERVPSDPVCVPKMTSSGRLIKLPVRYRD